MGDTTKKLTLKQETFCQGYVETGNASEAYRRAYDANGMKPEVVSVKASELLKNGKVTVRVEQLQAKHAKRHDVTVDTITAMLKEDRLLAREKEQPAAAVSAAMGLAKLHGLIIDKSKVELISHEEALRALKGLVDDEPHDQ